MNKVLYVHGFASSGASGTVKWLRDHLQGTTVVAPDIPTEPLKAIELLRRVAADEQPDLVIGTSMGGMLAEHLHGFDRILVNPAFEIAETLRTNIGLGMHTFFNARQDGQKEFLVTKKTLEAFREVTSHCFEKTDEEEQERVYGLFGTDDDLVHTYPLFCRHYRHAIRFKGGHRLDDHVRTHALMPVVRWIDDRQQGRQRPILYIALDGALRKADGKPLGSSVNAFEQLAAIYDVRVVASCPWISPEKMQADRLWVEDYLGVPAYDRLVFCNHAHLLYGDYYITPAPDPRFLGTSLTYGDDTFRTWEDVLTYFERLGGQ